MPKPTNRVRVAECARYAGPLSVLNWFRLGLFFPLQIIPLIDFLLYSHLIFVPAGAFDSYRAACGSIIATLPEIGKLLAAHYTFTSYFWQGSISSLA